MPRLSCWFIRAALAHLAVGVLIGTLLLSAKGLPRALGWAWLLLPAHIQLLVGGWLMQLTLGMAYWILPRLDGSGTRGRTRAATFSFYALNLGVDGAAILLALRGFSSAVRLDLLLIPAALLQLAALVAFVYHAWPRVRTTLTAPASRPRQIEPRPCSCSCRLARSPARRGQYDALIEHEAEQRDQSQ